ncbi:putative DNA-binding protein RHL1 [Cocos nucifera]|uniref:Putative DNA-binding protein RHL1 n=1 Tax=Cocos nucifera TaxID=13894 RepID=A0A8K0IKN0_COCNU|nr:putative DNA-binding protein RHL1 [Cocos nucifera]
MRKKSEKEENSQPADPETEEKKRLRSLAFSKKLLRRDPSKPSAPLEPSKSVLKLQGRDVVKRGQRKSRYLFSFPGLLAPLSGGRVGELADLGTKNPILYLEFPQGRMKLFGTHVYPKSKYLTLQLTKSSKGVVCEDTFDSLIVFSDAWWIGRKGENPEELKHEFPKNLSEGKHAADCDFKGGAGATVEESSGGNKPGKDYVEPLSPDTDMEGDMPEDSHFKLEESTKNLAEATPVRQSARTAGKKLSYAESSSGDDSIASDAEVPEMTSEKINIETEDSVPATSTILPPEDDFLEKKIDPMQETEESSSSMKRRKKNLSNKRGTLVQATLFGKVEDKKSKPSVEDSARPEGPTGKRQRKQKAEAVQSSKLSLCNCLIVKNTGTGTVRVQKKSKFAVKLSEFCFFRMTVMKTGPCNEMKWTWKSTDNLYSRCHTIFDGVLMWTIAERKFSFLCRLVVMKLSSLSIKHAALLLGWAPPPPTGSARLGADPSLPEGSGGFLDASPWIPIEVRHWCIEEYKASTNFEEEIIEASTVAFIQWASRFGMGGVRKSHPIWALNASFSTAPPLLASFQLQHEEAVGSAGMKALRALAIVGVGVCGILSFATIASADKAEHGLPPPSYPWPHQGILGSYDHASVVTKYNNMFVLLVIQYLRFQDPVGVAYTEEETKAMAAEIEVADGPNDEDEMFTHPGRLSDRLPQPNPNEQAARFANGGANPPYPSLITKVRRNGQNCACPSHQLP